MSIPQMANLMFKWFIASAIPVGDGVYNIHSEWLHGSRNV